MRITCYNPLIKVLSPCMNPSSDFMHITGDIFSKIIKKFKKLQKKRAKYKPNLYHIELKKWITSKSTLKSSSFICSSFISSLLLFHK